MLAGAQGFDYVLVVVAADDGVMPQTEEHFEICHLLGLERGAFVITKCDLVPRSRIDDVKAEVALLADDTSFAEAPGKGMNTLAMVTLICGSSSRGVTRMANRPKSAAISAISGVSWDVRKKRAIRPESPMAVSGYLAGLLAALLA